MADARLDLEVALEGDQQAAAGLDRVADSSKNISTEATRATKPAGELSGAIKNIGQESRGAQLLAKAYAQLMRGDFSGAVRSAAGAVKALWDVMLANPLTAVLVGITAAVAGLKLLMDWHDAAKERAKEHRLEISALGDELNEVLYGTVSENVKKNVGRMTSEGDREGLTKGKEGREKVNYQLAVQAVNLKNNIDNLKVGGFGKEKEQREKEERVEQYRDVLAQMRDNKAAIQEYKRGINELDKAEQKRANAAADRNAKELADKKKLVAEQEKLMQKELERLQDMQTGEGDLKAKGVGYARERALSGAPDKIAELEMRRKFLEKDLGGLVSNSSLEAESKRLDIKQEIWRIDQQIAEEEKRQADETDRAAKKSKDVTDQKRIRENLSGELNLGSSFGIDTPEGWKIDKSSKYRSLAEGRATQWFNNKNEGRLARQGIDITQTTDMSRMETKFNGAGHNPVERSNQLLEKIAERLG